MSKSINTTVGAGSNGQDGMKGKVMHVPMKAYYQRGQRVEILQGATFENVNVTVSIQKDFRVEGVLRVLGNVRVQGTVTVDEEALLGENEHNLRWGGSAHFDAYGTITRHERPLEFAGDHYRFDEDVRCIGDDEICIKGDLIVEGDLHARQVIFSGSVSIYGRAQYGSRVVEPRLSTVGRSRNSGT